MPTWLNPPKALMSGVVMCDFLDLGLGWQSGRYTQTVAALTGCQPPQHFAGPHADFRNPIDASLGCVETLAVAREKDRQLIRITASADGRGAGEPAVGDLQPAAGAGT